MGCFGWQKDKWFQKWSDELKEESSVGFQAQVWMQHLAQKVPKSLADKSQQGILGEIRLEME